MTPIGPSGRRAAMLACLGLAAAVPARAGTLSPRDLYDEAGIGPSPLARRSVGRRIALNGLVAPVPTGVAGWLALGETALVPCQLCGGPHDWPVGVVAVEAANLPHLADPFVRVTIEGVLALEAAPETGLDRLVLRDAGLASA
jgi:hypothetical protein